MGKKCVTCGNDPDSHLTGCPGVMPCHPACKCREVKVKELVEAAKNYHHISQKWRMAVESTGGDRHPVSHAFLAAIEGVKI